MSTSTLFMLTCSTLTGCDGKHSDTTNWPVHKLHETLLLQNQYCCTISIGAATCTASCHDTKFTCERMLRMTLGTRNATCLDRDLDLEFALLLDEYGDLLRLRCFPFSLVASRGGLPSGLEGSSFVCNTTACSCNVNRSRN